MNYPIFFKLPFEVRCQDTFARVLISGRALMAEEDGEWWCHGVDPGAITASGRSPHMAFIQFKVTLAEVLGEMADDAGACNAFETLVKNFVTASDRTELERWEQARLVIRAGQPVDWMLEKMQRVVGDWPTQATVEPLGQIETREEAVALAQGRVA